MRAYVLAVAGAACTVDDLLHALNRTFEGFKNIVETKLGPSLNMRELCLRLGCRSLRSMTTWGCIESIKASLEY